MKPLRRRLNQGELIEAAARRAIGPDAILTPDQRHYVGAILNAAAGRLEGRGSGRTTAIAVAIEALRLSDRTEPT